MNRRPHRSQCRSRLVRVASSRTHEVDRRIFSPTNHGPAPKQQKSALQRFLDVTKVFDAAPMATRQNAAHALASAFDPIYHGSCPAVLFGIRSCLTPLLCHTHSLTWPSVLRIIEANSVSLLDDSDSNGSFWFRMCLSSCLASAPQIFIHQTGKRVHRRSPATGLAKWPFSWQAAEGRRACGLSSYLVRAPHYAHRHRTCVHWFLEVNLLSPPSAPSALFLLAEIVVTNCAKSGCPGAVWCGQGRDNSTPTLSCALVCVDTRARAHAHCTNAQTATEVKAWKWS